MARGARQSQTATQTLDELLGRESPSAATPAWTRRSRRAGDGRTGEIVLTPDSTPQQWWQSLRRHRTVALPDPDHDTITPTAFRGATVLDLAAAAAALDLSLVQARMPEADEILEVSSHGDKDELTLDFYHQSFLPQTQVLLDAAVARDEFVVRYGDVEALDHRVDDEHLICDAKALTLWSGPDAKISYPITPARLAHIFELLRHEQVDDVDLHHRGAQGDRSLEVSKQEAGDLSLRLREDGVVSNWRSHLLPRAVVERFLVANSLT